MNDAAFIQTPAMLDAIHAHTAKLDFTMASEARTGALLQVLAASKPGGRMLEIGTGTGVATAWLLAGMDETSQLISVDVKAEFQAVARAVLGNDARLTLVVEDGAAFLQKQEAKSFDLVFADAMPGKYEALDDALALVKPGGFYIIDDMLEQPNWPEGHAAKVPVLLQQLLDDPRFVMAPMAWSSGLAIAVRKSE